MNRSSQHFFQHVASSAPSSHDIVMSDDDTTSRDSGVYEMMDENMPTGFSSLGPIEESMEVDENPVEVYRPGKISLRREKSSCQVRLFDASPNTPVAAPRNPLLALTFRSKNQQNSPSSQSFDNLKRGMVFGDKDDEYGRKSKLPRREEKRRDFAIYHYHTECVEEGDVDEDFVPTEATGDEDDVAVEELTDESSEEPAEEDMEENSSEESTSSPQFARPLAKARKRNNAGVTIHRVNTVKLTPIVLETGEEVEEEEADICHLNVKYHLITVKSRSSSCFRRITAEVLMGLIFSLSDEEFNAKYILIDCRYPYEYEGGHVKHAVNYYDAEAVENLFYDKNQTRLHNRIPIFYCEFSQKRGPSMANALRKIDRDINFYKYPAVCFDEIYVLDKGYRGFYQGCCAQRTETLCTPHNYVEMLHPEHTDTLKSYPFHKRNAPGQSMFRSNSAPVNLIAAPLPTSSAWRLPLLTSSSSQPSSSEAITEVTETTEVVVAERAASPDENQQPTNVGLHATPAPRNVFARQNSRRILFQVQEEQRNGPADSPTNYGKALPLRGNNTSPTVTPAGQLDLEE